MRSRSNGISSYYSNTGKFGIQSTTDVNEPISNIPNRFELYQNYPNPFNPSTVINFDLPEDANITLKIYSLLGKEELTLYDKESLKAGRYSKEINLSNLPSGVYFYKLSTDKYSFTRKMILIK